MAAPNMAAITASLERSLQNCSLNQSSSSSNMSGGEGAGAIGLGRSSSSDAPPHSHTNHLSFSPDTALELSSQLSLPHHWEQCLDLKTGEIYYIDWRNGVKATEDPRTATADYSGGGDGSGEYYPEDDNSSYESEESSSESSPASSSRERFQNDSVLVVAGCKSCLMYFMVPKQVQDCPKCAGQLLHFDRSENGSP
ncbi:protein CURLY FLAG LEAF 1-like [Malania oleifera]|uniref:protein CURLY FLAG LEAF 1-like n=1 Tax=Malania oleifera TaxID=397392 RepID=UPI0025AE99F3|nr:protein CURLY FLAG LEAF 1-like [Malania oleifera]